ncbi:MAG: PAS domain S-box protein, partial [Candidatus Omnitrophica bacterium]|nr:PAS domain S-box protein [Candidatus Omnitrophota bacterium]
MGLDYKKIFYRANIAIFVALAENGKIVDCNDVAEELVGRKRQEIVGMHQTGLHPPEHKEIYAGIFRRHASQMSGKDIEEVVQGKDGRRIPVIVSARTMEMSGTNVIVGVFKDITDRKKAEKDLEKSEQRYRAIIRNIPGMVYRARRDWSVEFVSGCEKVSGYGSEELLGGKINWLDLILPRDREKAAREGAKCLESRCSIV